MNHKNHSGNTSISTGNTDTPIGLVIEFPYIKEGCANAEASLGRISLQFPYAHIGHALAPTACVQAHIFRALTLAPTLYTHAHIGCALTPPLKTPHLGHIGVHPPQRQKHHGRWWRRTSGGSSGGKHHGGSWESTHRC